MSELAEIDHQELIEFAGEFREIMYDMPFQIPQDLLLLGRTLAILSGMCTGLDPAFNVWESIQPYAEDLIKSEVTGNIDLWLQELERLVRSLFTAPRRMEGALDLIESGKLRVQVPELQVHLVGIERNLQRLTGAIVFAALIMGGVQFMIAGQTLPGMLLMGTALVTLVVLIFR
jgi:predicted unusual protein kinase regulating ubiquinone biosynthesis (AarF/ABC1/UbiB family)